MRVFKICIIFVSMVACFELCAKDGVGIFWGSYSGILFNRYYSDEKSFDFMFSWKSSDNGYLYFLMDKTIHIKDQIEKRGHDFKFYYFYGFGCGFKFDDGTELSLRLPLGLKKDLKEDIDLFLKITPLVRLIDETDGDVELYGGFRYYFR